MNCFFGELAVVGNATANRIRRRSAQARLQCQLSVLHKGILDELRVRPRGYGLVAAAAAAAAAWLAAAEYLLIRETKNNNLCAPLTDCQHPLRWC